MSRGTAHRSVRIDDDIWDPAKAKAAEEGWDGGMSEVLRTLLASWLAGDITFAEQLDSGCAMS